MFSTTLSKDDLVVDPALRFFLGDEAVAFLDKSSELFVEGLALLGLLVEFQLALCGGQFAHVFRQVFVLDAFKRGAPGGYGANQISVASDRL